MSRPWRQWAGGRSRKLKRLAAHELDCEFCGGWLYPDLSGWGHHQSAFDVRIPPVDAQTNRLRVWVLWGWVPDNLPNEER